MLSPALVHNLLSAIGAALHLTRPNLAQPANYYQAGGLPIGPGTASRSRRPHQ